MPVFTCVGQSCSRPARLFKGLALCSMQYSVCHDRRLFGDNLRKGALSLLWKLSQTRLLLTHLISATSVCHCCVVCDVDNQTTWSTQNRELSLQLHACISTLCLSEILSSSHSPVQSNTYKQWQSYDYPTAATLLHIYCGSTRLTLPGS